MRPPNPVKILQHAAGHIGFGPAHPDVVLAQRKLLSLASGIRFDRQWAAECQRVRRHLDKCADCRRWEAVKAGYVKEEGTDE
jgi:hypothetical protein